MELPWSILTGEYPPDVGGVSDYTRRVAAALADSGAEVHVWTPRREGRLSGSDHGVTVHQLPGNFDLESLGSIERFLARANSPHRLLVEYVPHAFGMKGVNLPFALWLASRSREPVWAMFHEVALPWGSGFGPRHNVAALIQRLMAAILAGAAERVFVSVPAWGTLLRRLAPGAGQITWLPIPSTIPSEVSPKNVQEKRRELGLSQDAHVVGHFGTFGDVVTSMLDGILDRVLDTTDAHVLLLGRGATSYRSAMAERRLTGMARVSSRERIGGAEVAAYLSVCDVIVQPFPDGVSARRTSMMASLALGRAIVTNVGPLSEDFWCDSEAVAIVEPSSSAYAEAVSALLFDQRRRETVEVLARSLYREKFTLERVIETLRSS